MSTENNKRLALYTQAEADYQPNGGALNPRNQACSTCRWFMSYGGGACHIIENHPADIVSNGWCNQWSAMVMPEPEPDETPGAITDVTIMVDERQYHVATAPTVTTPEAPVPPWYKRLIPTKQQSAFKALGNGWWLAFPTNNFLDRTDEILKGEAHKRYVARVKAGLVPMPELWRSHTKGTRHGVAHHIDTVETDGVVTVFAIGRFDDTPTGKAAEAFYRKAKPGDVSLSHGFIYPIWAKAEGQYRDYNMFEITTLPRGEEANLFTNFETKEYIMPLTQAQRADIEKVFGSAAPDLLSAIDARGEADKTLASLGVQHKDFGNFADLTGTGEAPAATSDNGEAEALKSLLPTLFEDSARVIQLMDAMSKRMDALQAKHETERKAWLGKIEALEKALAAEPVPASAAPSTAVPAENEAAKNELAAKQQGKTGEYAEILPGLYPRT